MGYVAGGVALKRHFRGDSRFEMKIMIVKAADMVGCKLINPV
jgi:hypothetical protein